jgi:hypothetical protein
MNNEPTTAEKRQAALKFCIIPSRYTADPDVINNPEELKKVQAEWDAYFAKTKAIYDQYPLTKNEKELYID